MRTRITGAMLKEYQEIVRKQMIPYQWKVLNDQVSDVEPSHVIENFEIAAGRKSGEYFGMVFQDSDLYKWIEACAYSLSHTPDPGLEQKVDWVVDLIADAQLEDGYINTYYQVKEGIEHRWTNLRDNHELYCMGHMFEAAVAYRQATGKEKFLNVAVRAADYIVSYFGPGKCQGYPGHEEVELALVKLYLETGKPSYLELAKFFVDQRGTEPNYFMEESKKYHRAPYQEWWGKDYLYSQAHRPVREQKEVVGHAVRAVYFYCAVADLARLTDDAELKAVIEGLWNNVTKEKMSVNGGIGASGWGEAFADAYDLPSDTPYNETCASVGLAFWAERMLKLESKGEYADILEKVIYNACLCGMDVEGKHFFYVNPLEINHSSEKRRDHQHVRTERQGWFACACCPPNLARLIESLGDYVYRVSGRTVFVDLYAESSMEHTFDTGAIRLIQKTEYPWEETVNIQLELEKAQEFTLALRIPGWAETFEIRVNGQIPEPAEQHDGYLYLRRSWQHQDTVQIVFPMEVRNLYGNPKVTETLGKTAVSRGPVIYCAEEHDNGAELATIALTGKEYRMIRSDELLKGVVYLKTAGEKTVTGDADSLYGYVQPERKETELTLIPYFLWGNRGYGELAVWFRA